MHLIAPRCSGVRRLIEWPLPERALMSKATAQAVGRALHLVSATSRCEGAVVLPSVSSQWLRWATLSLALTLVMPYSMGPVMYQYCHLIQRVSSAFLCADTTVEVFQSIGAETPLTTQAQPSWGPHLTTWRCEQMSQLVFARCHHQCHNPEHVIAFAEGKEAPSVSACI